MTAALLAPAIALLPACAPQRGAPGVLPRGAEAPELGLPQERVRCSVCHRPVVAQLKLPQRDLSQPSLVVCHGKIGRLRQSLLSSLNSDLQVAFEGDQTTELTRKQADEEVRDLFVSYYTGHRWFNQPLVKGGDGLERLLVALAQIDAPDCASYADALARET